MKQDFDNAEQVFIIAFSSKNHHLDSIIAKIVISKLRKLWKVARIDNYAMQKIVY